jgi:hypothetical protein
MKILLTVSNPQAHRGRWQDFSPSSFFVNCSSLPWSALNRLQSRTNHRWFVSTIALLTIMLTTACQPTVQTPDSISLTAENKLEIDRYLAAKILQPGYGGPVFCSHNLLGAELTKQPQKLYIAMHCQEYYFKDGESLRTGTETLGPVALTIEQSSTNLTIVSHQITESKAKGPTLEDLFPAAILPAVKQANRDAAPELIQANEAKAKRYFVQEPVIKRLSGTWIGPSLSPLANPKTQELRTFTPQGITYAILRNGGNFLAVPSRETYQIDIPIQSAQPKPMGISMGQIGIFELSAKDQQLKLNLVTPPDRRPTTFTGLNSLTFHRQTDQNLKIMANIEGQAAEILALGIQKNMANVIETGKFDPTEVQFFQYQSNAFYRFKAQVIDDRRLQITAVASPTANLPSFTAGVILAALSPGVPGGKKTPMLIGGICRSLQPSSSALPMPTLTENQEVITCPPGSQRLTIKRS